MKLQLLLIPFLATTPTVMAEESPQLPATVLRQRAARLVRAARSQGRDAVSLTRKGWNYTEFRFANGSCIRVQNTLIETAATPITTAIAA